MARDLHAERGAPYPTETAPADRSIGELVGQVATDLSALVREEIDLAKAEARTEATKAGKAAGMFGGAGFGGYMVALFGTVTAFFAIALAVPYVYAALCVTVGWALVGGALALAGRAEMRRVRGMATTQQTLKEDVQWARELRK